MLWANRWRRLSQWFERLPLWVRVAVFPLVAPAVLAAAAACLCPRTSAAAGLVLVVVHGLLLRRGILGWEEVDRTVGGMYLLFVVVAYVGVLGGLLERAIDRLPGRKATSPEQGSRTVSSTEEQ
jgi:hypothetical protein